MECAELQSVVLVPPFSWFCCLCCLFLFITALVIPKITIVTIAQQLVLVPVVGAIPHAPGFTVRQGTCAASSIHCRPSGVCFVAAAVVIRSSIRVRRRRPSSLKSPPPRTKGPKGIFVLVPPSCWFCCLFLFITALVIPKITIVTIAQQIVLVPVIEIPHALVFTTFIDD